MPKISVTKEFLAGLPKPLAEHIQNWRNRTRRRHIGFEEVAKVTISEDGRYTAFSPDGSASKSARAVGEWNGVSGIACNVPCPLPAGCWLVEEEIFLGRFYLRLYRGLHEGPAELQLVEDCCELADGSVDGMKRAEACAS